MNHRGYDFLGLSEFLELVWSDHQVALRLGVLAPIMFDCLFGLRKSKWSCEEANGIRYIIPIAKSLVKASKVVFWLMKPVL